MVFFMLVDSVDKYGEGFVCDQDSQGKAEMEEWTGISLLVYRCGRGAGQYMAVSIYLLQKRRRYVTVGLIIIPDTVFCQ